MDDTQRRVDAIRKDRSELENHIIDEYSAGKITRREFVRRGTVVGMSIPLVSFLAAACGGGGGGETTGGGTTPTATGAVQAGGNIRVAIIQTATEPNPVIVKDEGGAGLLGSTGEFLSFSNAQLELVPTLAESWSPNADGTEWTFKIRQGVTFHSGATMTANDVKTTFETLVDPKNAVQRALRARRRPLAGEHRGTRRRNRRLPSRRAERQLPHARQLGQLQRDHHSGRPRSGGLGEDVRRHRAVQARQLHAQGRREVRPQRRLLGREGEPRLDGAQVLRRRRADDRRDPGRRGRLRRALLGLGWSRRS